MQRITPEEKYEYTEESPKDMYIDILNNINNIKDNRKEILLSHFNELLNCNINYLEDRSSFINRIINKELVYPNAFLASSLGFNRITWQQGYEKILSEIGMYKRPRYSTLKNMLHFEKLKWLIIRHFEKRKKNIKK